MNTSSLKRFASEARRRLMQGVRNRLTAVGFDTDGSVAEAPRMAGDSVIFGGAIISDPLFYPRWQALKERIEAHGVKDVVEEAAYTWFNRLMAIRILVRNGLCAPVLDYENPAVRLPRIVTDARAGRVASGLSGADRAALEAVIDDGRRSFEQFSILICSFCKSNPIVSACFGGITDYTALLLPSDILGEGGFLDMLNSSDDFISPDDWAKPELIGWLYQFYISEKKDEVFAKKGGYESDEIPAATQIFTPNWIVKYMVENTLGRIYLDNNPGSDLASTWKYLVETPSDSVGQSQTKSDDVRPSQTMSDDVRQGQTQSDNLLEFSSLEELKCADLSCGSGHILNEMFDLLMQLYTEEFYSPRQAVEAIFTQNMIGIDIDIRARQLAQFALLLRACQTDRIFADGHCLPRIYSFPDVSAELWEALSSKLNIGYNLPFPGNKGYAELTNAFNLMEDADTLGSIMKFDISEPAREYLEAAVKAYDAAPQPDPFGQLIDGMRIILALTDKYAAICMNPPYMSTGKEPRLKNYALKNYPDSRSDLFAIFMDVAIDRLQERGKYGMINMQSWMFLSSYEDLRKRIIDNQQIDSLLHLGPRTFDELSGEVVQNAAFVISNEKPEYSGIYYRLVDGKSCNAKREMYLAGDNRFIVGQKQFEKIPGAPIAYWVSPTIIAAFAGPSIEDYSEPRVGMATADNDRFMRLWYEISMPKFGISYPDRKSAKLSKCKWFPFSKGGAIRKWYGNHEYVVNWENDGSEIRNFKDLKTGRIRSHNYNLDYIFQSAITWGTISSGKPTFRLCPVGFLYSNSGYGMFFEDRSQVFPMLAFLNSPISLNILNLLSPGIGIESGYVRKLPFIEDNNFKDFYCKIVGDNISISKADWDAHETSWDFQTSPLIEAQKDCGGNGSLLDCVNCYKSKWERNFYRLHANEEELNRRFIEIYGLQDELTPDVPLDEVTILQQGEMKIRNKEEGISNISQELEWQDDVIIKQFMSYAVGVMMGRYRLDRPGLAIAHPNPSDDETAPYSVRQSGTEWWIDDDGIVPMMGADCGFHDNAANRFDTFIEAVFGPELKTANLNFVREALGKDPVDYFRNDFYADHKRMYQNRPIYWMFSSNQKGRRAAFQCLVYMHRMNRFTPEKVRTDYLLPYIETLSARQAELQSLPSLTARQAKELKQLAADLDECRDYQLRLHDFADRQIDLDLDDGVVKNYSTFATVLAKLK